MAFSLNQDRMQGSCKREGVIDISDIGEIKARVTISYDGAGIDEAKKDLSSLSDIVGGGLTENVGTANEALASLDEQMGKNAGSASDLVSSVGAIEKPMQASADAVSSVNEVLGEQQAAVENAGTALEGMQKPLEDTTTLMQNAAPPMKTVVENATAMQAPLDAANTGFVQMSESLNNAVPLMPQMASGISGVAEALDPKALGLSAATDNLAVFQDALSNPQPYQLIGAHLDSTGQSWGDFFSSVGTTSATFSQQMIDNAKASQASFGTISSGAQSAEQSFYVVGNQTNALSQSIAGINTSGGVGTALYGPADSWSKLNAGLASTEEGINKLGGVGANLYGPEVPINLGSMFDDISGSMGKGFGGFVQSFDSFMRPLMYLQMAGMMVGAVSTGIYNMAALAEGPAAHSIGSFTGAIDVMGQQAQQTGQQFSEGLGQGILPMINAMNNVSGNSKNTDFWGAVGTGIGQVGSLLGTVGQVAAGAIMDLPWLAFTPSTNISSMPGNNLMQQGWEGLQNLWAQITGGKEPFPTPGTPGSQVSSVQASINAGIPAMYAQANDPGYLAAQAYASSQMGYATLGQTRYDVSHLSGFDTAPWYQGVPTAAAGPLNYAPQAYQQSLMPQILATGGAGSGLDAVDLNRLYFEAADARAALVAPETPGCFPAGTPVLLADGTEKAIETLHSGDRALAHDGTKQVTTTILALIKPPPKLVYKLAFDDGNTLTLTDSHPVSTDRGWKSLSPDATRKENPDFAVTVLQIGDRIHTVGGTCTLLAIQPCEIVQVYNITVGEQHTFYAGGILVHNKISMTGTQVMQNVANTTVPDMDMKNTNLIQSLASNFTGADISHTFTASVNWAATGDLAHTFQGSPGWATVGELAHIFLGAPDWATVGELAHTFQGIANWVATGGLQHSFEGILNWVVPPEIQHTFEGIANWVTSGEMAHTFQGWASWVGQELTHTFTAVANWVVSGLSQTASVPGFAAGVQNFGGGLAVVGEYGPELVHLPQGTSVYPQSATGGFSGLNMGSIGDSGQLNLTINHTTMLNGKVMAQETIPLIAPILRSQMAVRR
jgi:hypothetical protein